MKSLLSAVAAFLVLSIALSCKKDANSSLEKSIVGQWKYLYSKGGFTGTDSVGPPPNTTIILSLKTDQTYTTTANGQITQQGTYRINNIQSIFTDSPQPAIQFDSVSPGDGLLIELAEPNLTLTDNHVEPFGSLYERVH